MDAVTFGLTCFISILAIINPFSTIAVFLSLMKGERLEEKHRNAFLTSLVALIVLLTFAITGYFIFQIYSITIEAFRIAGGIVLFILGSRMLFSSSDGKKHSKVEEAYIVPLAIPMTSGPGAITTTVVLASQAVTVWHEFALWTAIFAACTINFIVLRYSDIIDRKVGGHGVDAMTKIIGLLVCALGVQFIIVGLKAAFPILG